MTYIKGESGVIVGNAGKNYPKIYWSQKYDVSTNSSIVTIDKITIVMTSTVYNTSLYLGDLNAYADSTDNGLYINDAHVQPMSIKSGNWRIVTNGQGEFTVQTKSSGSDQYIDYTESFEIIHDANGCGTFTVGLLIDYIYASPTLRFSNFNIDTTTIELAKIPRASTIDDVQDIYLGDECSIKWTPLSADFKYKLSFSLANWKYDVSDYITPNINTIYTYVGIPSSEKTIDEIEKIYSELPNKTFGQMTVTLTTYNVNNEQIGNGSSKTFTVTIPDSIKPTLGDITVNITEINNNKILVQSKNTVQIDVDASGCSAGAGSSINSYKFDCIQNKSIVASITTTDTSAVFGPFTQHGDIQFRVTAIDGRQRSTSKDSDLYECYEYYLPSFSNFNVYRSDMDGTADVNGEYLMCSYVALYANVNNTNQCTIKLKYSGGEQSEEEDLSDNNLPIYVGNNTITYKVYATITDSYGGTYPSPTITVFGASRILNITKDGTGMAIGKMADENNLFECRWNAKFNGELSCKSLLVDGKSISGSANGMSEIDLINLIYPVGSVYISVNPGDVCDISFGTWVRLNAPAINGVYMWTRTE